MRVCLKGQEDVVGTIVEEIGDGEVWVVWDAGTTTRMRVKHDRLLELPAEGAGPPSTELQLLTIIDNLRDAFNLAIECAARDIQRLIKKQK